MLPGGKPAYVAGRTVDGHLRWWPHRGCPTSSDTDLGRSFRRKPPRNDTWTPDEDYVDHEPHGVLGTGPRGISLWGRRSDPTSASVLVAALSIRVRLDAGGDEGVNADYRFDLARCHRGRHSVVV